MNRVTNSAIYDFILKISDLTHVTFIGNQSGSRGGGPVVNELPDGWKIRFSTTMTFAPDRYNVETGIPPDYFVELDPEDEINGIDTILEFVMELTHNGTAHEN